jgi:PAS domain S-box-containing protein
MENRPRPDGASFLARIALPSALAVALFIGATFFFIIPSFERNMMERKRETIRELNNSVHSLLENFYREEAAGRLTRAQAQRKAADSVRALRYGPEDKDYFWITDLAPRMIVHPYRPDLDGKDLADFKDSHGKRLFVEFAEIGRRGGAGYSDYMWQWKDDPARVVPKLSHVRLFAPWGWVTGTGIYIEDVREEIARLEANLIKISLLIAAIIALILLYVNQQSLRIERSRRAAEALLAGSEEKYRKLTEAATEGIMMVLGGKPVYFNRILLDLLGYAPEELERLGLAGLLAPGSAASAEYLGELLESGETPPQLEAALLRKDGETFRALLTASRLQFGGREGFILTVKDIDRHKRTEEELSESREKFRLLTDTINLGVFRLDLAGSGFTEANPAAARILGYPGVKELLGAGAAALGPFEGAGLLREAAAGRPVREAPAFIRPGLPSERSLLVSLIPLSADGGAPRQCDGLLEDITARKRSEAEREKLLADLQLSLGSLNQSVRGVARKAAACPVTTPVGKAAELMTAAGSSCILVEAGGEVLGVVTDHDLRARVLAGRNTAQEPVSRVMSSPIISVPETALLFEAVLLMQEKNIRHLAVKDAAGRINSVIDEKELLALKWYSPAMLMGEFAAAASVEAVVSVRGRLPRLVKTLADSGADSAGITRLVSSAADAATARFVDFAVKELGEPPVPFAFMALGSQARHEQTLATDQDNALVYADPPPGQEKAAEEYFQALAGKVCAWLAEAGYPYCKGAAMANNPKWCRPLSAWKGYFTEWAGVTDPQALLDVNVFFDFRCVAGEKALEESLRAHVRVALKDKKIFFLNLANNALLFKVPLGFRGGVAVEDEGEFRGTFDAKQLLRVFTDFARIYALRGDLTALPTAGRLAALADANVLDQGEKESFSQAFETLMRLRLRRQAALAGAGSPADNRLRPAELSQADQLALKETAAAAGEAMNKLKYLVKFLIV